MLILYSTKANQLSQSSTIKTMKDQNTIKEKESQDVKWNRGLDLFIESVHKPDDKLRSCAHNQDCYDELMDVKEKVLEYLQTLRKPQYTEKDYWEGRVPDDQFEKYLNKYGYEYTPTVTVDKPTRRARHSDLDAL